MVSFMLQLLYLHWKSPKYLLDRGLDGSQRQSGHYAEEKNLLPLSGVGI
jgi:hypothetical protein